MANATVSPNSLPEQPTRRTILARLATGAAVAGIPGAALASGPSDPHPEWWRRREEIRDWINGPGAELPDEVTDQVFDDGCKIEDLIAATPAASLVGVRVQLAMVLHSMTEVGSHNDTDVAALANALATLERLAGEAAHG